MTEPRTAPDRPVDEDDPDGFLLPVQDCNSYVRRLASHGVATSVIRIVVDDGTGRTTVTLDLGGALDE
jgi:hypothetical protein